MKALINNAGWLYFYRRGRVAPIFCPYSEDRHCGDWCALFGEPYQDGPTVVLPICRTTLVFDELTDERP